MTNAIGDIEKAGLLLVTGSNTTENHPVLSGFVKRAVKQKNARLILVDPRRIQLAAFAHKWLRPNPGTDVAWINGLMHVIIKEKLFDEAFVENRTTGFDALKEMVEKFTPEYVYRLTGIPEEELCDAARMYAGTRPAAILYCMGITQHAAGTDNVKSLANLAMLCGNIGMDGGGVNPLRGQNNVQGACDMGGLPNVFTGYQRVNDPEIVKRMARAWGVDGLSGKPGFTATEMIPNAHNGTIKAMYIIGENPVISDPDANHTEKSLSALDFLVVQDIFMTETARMADVVLPAACFAEKEGTFTNTERRVQRVRKAVEPPDGVREDWRIIRDIAAKMEYAMSGDDAEAIFDEIAAVTPSYAGITYTRIEKTGIHWPCPNPDHPGTPVLHAETFPIGRGVFFPIDFSPPVEPVDADYPLYLTTGRVLYQYHTGTMTRRSTGLNERAPESFVEISPDDAEKYDLKHDEMVNIASRRGEIQVRLNISDKAVAGTVFIPFHFAEAAANRLTLAALDPVSKIPEYKVCAVRISKAA